MLPIRTILHATDFSVDSTAAFGLACSLARDLGARLVLLHVKPTEVDAGGFFYPLPPDPAQVRGALLHRLWQLRPPDPAVRVEHVLREGDPAREILAAAHEAACDLIVLGTHGRTGINRLLTGSVAEAVLRRAPCPVLTLRNFSQPSAAPLRSQVQEAGTG
jgi:nucleotide-binding universal stress UspA family protein